MITFNNYYRLLTEGGNIWSDKTGRINKQDVIPTVKNLEKLTGLELVNNMLGSTGKAPSSGDIDLAVDSKLINKNNLQEILNKIGKTTKTGISVHLLSPIWSATGDKTDQFVQVDFMFSDDVDYLKFFNASNELPPLKGRDRNVLLSAVAKHKGYILSSGGLTDRATKQLITRNPDTIAHLVFGPTNTSKDLSTVPNIIQTLVKMYGTEKAKQIVAPAEVTTNHNFINV